MLFGWRLSKFALGLLLLVAGMIAWLRKPWRDTGRLLLFISLAHMGSRLVAGTLKNVFERLRPYEVIASGDWHSFFAADGNSFPSTHSAHFWSLFFPLALAFPRYRLWFSIVPLFISVARVGVNDHFVSDVLAGAAIAAFMTWALSGLVAKRVAADETGGLAEVESNAA
jgi:membrane-associated phospholipid phosphatase